MPRGGRRQGKPGANYSNRTDLALGPRKLPLETAPGQEYGAAKQQLDAQRAVPITTQPAGLPVSASPVDVHQQAREFTPPPVVPMGAPTMNPGEPVTAGIPTGPGPTMPPSLPPSPVLQGVALLNTLGESATPETKAMLTALTAAQNQQAAP